VIKTTDDFVAGQLADAFFDDFLLENDVVKVVIAHPGKKSAAGLLAGSIIDVALSHRKLDYLNSIQAIPDLETTGSHIEFEYADAPTVQANTTATLVLHGKAVTLATDDVTTVALDAVTTYTLGKNSNVLNVQTAFYNSDTSNSVYLLPGDVVDWGEANGFVEGIGIPQGSSTVAANYVAGFASDYTVGLVTSGTQPIRGFYTSRDAVVPAWQPPTPTSSTLARPTSLQRAPAQRSTGPQYTAADFGNDPLGILRARIARGDIKIVNEVHGTETSYSSANVLNTTSSATAVREITSATLAALEKQTGKKLMPDVPAVEDRPDTSTRKLVLPAGQTFAFSRYVVVSDADFSRIANFAYTEKQVYTGYIAGAVLESTTDKPVADADVYINGGPGWNGSSAAPAFYKVRTRSDGTFACRVPAGPYVVNVAKTGRMSLSPISVMNVKAGPRPQTTVLLLSPESTLRVAISEAETPTSMPLPVKLTFVPKQGTGEVNWGDGPRGDHGVRNTWFLPFGAANIPLSPGRYQVFVSRGIEYDSQRADIELAPGGQQTLKLSLPHTMMTMLPGMFSVDAGLFTNASASGAATIEDRVIQAACEGVDVIVSGDYNRATDFQPVIEKLGLTRWLKSYIGMRLLLHKGDLAAEVLAYPLTKETAAKLTTFLPQVASLPPDLALADLRKAFPGVLLEICKPSDPERGYFSQYYFDPISHSFGAESLPPPDYDSIQIFEGKKLGLEQQNYPRYSALQNLRSQDDLAKVPPLSPTAYSASSLPFGQEVGYPRLYIQTAKKTLPEITADDILQKIRTQHYTVTNGPILSIDAQSYPRGDYDKHQGDVIDLSTTRILRLQMNVLASSWVSFSGLALHEQGLVQVSTPNVRIVNRTKRFPVLDQPDVITRYIDKDTIIDGVAYGANRPLWPIISNALPDLGGPVYPYAFTAPLFIDKDADGKIRLTGPENQPPPPKEADATETSTTQ
jgi:hypothetical protein